VNREGRSEAIEELRSLLAVGREQLREHLLDLLVLLLQQLRRRLRLRVLFGHCRLSFAGAARRARLPGHRGGYPRAVTEQSAQHGAALDDALKNDRRQSSAGTRHHERSEDDPTGRSAVAFPGDAAHIRMVAADNDATDEVRALLARLPTERRYATVADVVDALRS
jgi:hypothetical protein